MCKKRKYLSRKIACLIGMLIILSSQTTLYAKSLQEYSVDKGCYITLADEVIAKLSNEYYTGWITFEYLDEENSEIIIEAASEDKAQFGRYEEVAKITKTDTKEWKKAKISLTNDFIQINHEAENNADFVFKGKGMIRDIKIEFNIIKQK